MARKVLRLDAKDQIAAALPLFFKALNDNVAAIKAHDKAKAEWATAIVEIIFGVAAPIFARWLVSREGVTQRFASELSQITKTSNTAKHLRAAKSAAEAAEVAEDMAWKAAQAKAEWTIAQDALTAARGRSARKGADKAMRQAKAAAKQAESRAKELDELATEAQEAYAQLAPVELISDNELLKETLKGAFKVPAAHLKEDVERLWGEDDLNEFSNKLADKFHDVGLDLEHQLNEDITNYPDSEGKNFSDKQLTALYVMYDREHANLKTYRAVLKKTLEDFRTYIRVIENDESIDPEGGWSKHAVRAVRVMDRSGKTYVYLLHEWDSGGIGYQPGGDNRYVRITDRVPDEMAPYAIEKTEAEFGKGSVQTISWIEAVTVYNMKP